MRRVKIAVLLTAGLAVAVVWVSVLSAAFLFGRGTRAPDPDPPGIDTLDRAAVERLARITLPADAAGLHTRYAEGIDYSLSLCFTTKRTGLPSFLADGQLPAPTGPAPTDFAPAPGCPDPLAVRSSEQEVFDGVFRRVLVGVGPDGSAVVYLVAFTT